MITKIILFVLGGIALTIGAVGSVVTMDRPLSSGIGSGWSCETSGAVQDCVWRQGPALAIEEGQRRMTSGIVAVGWSIAGAILVVAGAASRANQGQPRGPVGGAAARYPGAAPFDPAGMRGNPAPPPRPGHYPGPPA